VEGVLNPASVRGSDGHLYLFPRLVARGNYSSIGIARVLFDAAGNPVGVERLGVALEPEAAYELRTDGGGCEDPRVTFFEALRMYVMTYTAFSDQGPRIALAISEDLFHWWRLGLATFAPFTDGPYAGIDFNGVNNKDAVMFPAALRGPDGKPALAMIHRPLFPGTDAPEMVCRPPSRPVDLSRESMWISYCPVEAVGHDPTHLCHFQTHHRLASPVADWERLKIGSGAPPLLIPEGWLVIYHGVCEAAPVRDETEVGKQASVPRLQYAAGVMVLEYEHPQKIRYRSPTPILTPELPLEREGAVANVVFPTGTDRRFDRSSPSRVDVYYGMADSRIGAAYLELPKHFPAAKGLLRDRGSDCPEDKAEACQDQRP
jgi:predicted GH43/DUF377 family glycosyl hydrolase